MNKINTFFYILKQSLSNPSYYVEAANAKFKFLFKYVFIFSIVFGIFYNVGFIYIYNNVSKNWPAVYKELKTSIYQIYPSDLQVIMNNGELSINKTSPVFIKVPSNFKNVIELIDPTVKYDTEFNKFFNEYNLAVIDTNAKVEDIRKYKTLSFFTKNSYAFVSKNSSEKSLQYEFGMYERNNKISTINKNSVDLLLNEGFNALEAKVFPVVIKIAYVLLYTLWLIIGICMLVNMLFTHLFTTLVGLIISKIIKSDMSYKQLYKMGLLLFPFFMSIDLLNNLIKVPGASFMSIVLYITVFSVVINKFKNTPTTVEIAK